MTQVLVFAVIAVVVVVFLVVNRAIERKRQARARAVATAVLTADGGTASEPDLPFDADDRLAAARRYYNTVVARHNRRCESLPSNVVARRHGSGPAGYFAV